MGLKISFRVPVILVSALILILALSSTSVATSEGVKITTSFPRIEVNPGQNIQLTVNVNNLSADYQTLSLQVAAPEGWQANLKSGGYLVKMVTLAPFENQPISLTITQPTGVSLGSYTVVINALDSSGNIIDSLSIVVDVAEVSPLGLTLSTTSPSIEGPAGKSFQFSVDLVNETGEERDIDLSYIAPANWTVTFSPGYESTLIRTIHMKAGARQTLRITVTPASTADAGEYPITVLATSGAYSQSLDLKAIITGTYTMDLSTSDGLLNLSAPQGEVSTVTLVVSNTGSGTLEKMGFRSSGPSGWEIKFDPDQISSILPGSSAQVVVSIKPPADAIPGDYSLRITASTSGSNSVSKTIELRVTVLGSIVWGIVGLVIIIIVVLGLVFIFWRLGRR
ncbi:MAG: NEW3 domain-containing protein [Candidatus Hadarchaeum sp.]|uniref:COG1470 family protein n=1 Tax=Candidatus Hadarchaeum sp. TaxID=2883567 RepID=UPI003D0F2D0E